MIEMNICPQTGGWLVYIHEGEWEGSFVCWKWKQLEKLIKTFSLRDFQELDFTRTFSDPRKEDLPKGYLDKKIKIQHHCFGYYLETFTETKITKNIVPTNAEVLLLIRDFLFGV